MEVRQMATAFLFHGNDVLMMKKSGGKIYESEFWTGLGGHLEPEELNEPKKACIREIGEESGIGENDLADLRLTYILLRIKGEEIRQQFVYFGRTMKREFVPSEEGELFWIDRNELRHLRTSKVVGLMLDHYFRNPEAQDVRIGTMTITDDGEPRIQWSALKDPLVF